MTDSEFGIGFVGAGFITRDAHAPSVQHVPGATVAAVLNPTESKAEAVAADCRETGAGAPTTYGEGEVAALANDPDVDGVWVLSPNHTRVGVVEAVVEAVADGADLSGIALEKPVARDLAETHRVRALVAEADLPHAYLENWAHEPDVDRMRSLLWERGRTAGRPYIARSKAEHGGPHSAWFWDGRRQGGGALTDMLCHSLAGNELLLTDPESDGNEAPGLTATSVSADVETLKWAHEPYVDELREEHGVDYDAHPADDYARATVRYETADGRPVVSEATGSWCYVGAGVSRQIELLGPEYSGQVVTDETSSSVFFSDALGEGEGWAEKQTATSGRMPVAAATTVTGGYVAENRDAVEAFERGRNARLDLADGERVMRLCMAAYRGAETGSEVDPRGIDPGYTPPPARD